jgi:hypothetical protein
VTAGGVHYRKLPGHRRGLFRGASVWLGPDHLLLVRSLRFREEYKRYQLRDIQAIVVARDRRFHISTRSLGIAFLWFLAFIFAVTRPWGPAVLWTSALALIAAWACVSYFFSCRCRIYTAVSRDDLPSLYRVWTARRFLREVEPRIAAVQGTVQNWADEIENRDIGPADMRPDTSGVPPPPKPRPAARTRTLASDFLILCLFADAIWNTVTLNVPGWLHGAGQTMALLLTLAAILVVVQHHRGRITMAMQRLALAVLIGIGLMYYFRPIVTGMMIGASASANKRTPLNAARYVNPAPWMRTVEAVMTALLGVTGLAIVLAGGDEQEPPAIAPPT